MVSAQDSGGGSGKKRLSRAHVSLGEGGQASCCSWTGSPSAHMEEWAFDSSCCRWVRLSRGVWSHLPLRLVPGSVDPNPNPTWYDLEQGTFWNLSFFIKKMKIIPVIKAGALLNYMD